MHLFPIILGIDGSKPLEIRRSSDQVWHSLIKNMNKLEGSAIKTKKDPGSQANNSAIKGILLNSLESLEYVNVSAFKGKLQLINPEIGISIKVF